jgi:hypothetical protein
MLAVLLLVAMGLVTGLPALAATPVLPIAFIAPASHQAYYQAAPGAAIEQISDPTDQVFSVTLLPDGRRAAIATMATANHAPIPDMRGPRDMV